MKILIACEESQRVCAAFRERGHEAYSCDILECSGGRPDWHIVHDVTPLLYGQTRFFTQDDVYRTVPKWDMIIAFPPCTYLTVTGNRWFNIDKYGDKARKRWENRLLAVHFFMNIVNADCDKIAIENPIGVMSSIYRKPDQIIQPYYFGHPERKSTCLWLKGLPPLSPTNIVEPVIIKHKSGRTDDPWHYNTISLPPKERSKERSKTYPGIAAAMAEQWR